jgi:cytoskeletal protein CcmA (bactofilin family)
VTEAVMFPFLTIANNKVKGSESMLDQRVDAASSSVPNPTRQVRPSNASEPSSSTPSPGDRSTIGKSLLIKGEITGSESLYVEGKVEGSINLPGDRVTVGRNGRVSASIAARDIVVLGAVLGNCEASDHLDIRSEGSLYGDVLVSRISVEDGAFLTGSIDIQRASVLEAVEHDQVELTQVN